MGQPGRKSERDSRLILVFCASHDDRSDQARNVAKQGEKADHDDGAAALVEDRSRREDNGQDDTGATHGLDVFSQPKFLHFRL